MKAIERARPLEEEKVDLISGPAQPGKSGRDVFPAHCCGLPCERSFVSLARIGMIAPKRLTCATEVEVWTRDA